jgi:hypothetical protein
VMIHLCNRFATGGAAAPTVDRGLFTIRRLISFGRSFIEAGFGFCLRPIRLDRPTNAYTLPTKSGHSSSKDKVLHVKDAVQGLLQVGVVETKPGLEHSGRDAFSAG